MALRLSKNIKAEFASELDNILEYWKNFSADGINGGFLGKRDHNNKVIPNASKGIILNTRILWSFSTIGNFQQNKETRILADRAYHYLKEKFRDEQFQGVFWLLNAQGKPVNKRKQIYAQAFAIYSLSEYFLLSKNDNAKEWAISLFELVEKYAKDEKRNGYLEAFQEDWSPIFDMRLSEKDQNAAKTMNTHLHILEAYTALFKITGDERVILALENLINLFLDKFLKKGTNHFHLFFDENWNEIGNTISFGHDIEAAWLLIEAAKAVGDNKLVIRTESAALALAETFLKEAYIKNAGIINEKDIDSGKIDTDRHWWPQAEAMLGLAYAHKISGDPKFLDALIDIWNFTKVHIIDHENGEWFFRIDKNNVPYKNEDKLGMWKGPYHSSRACIILLKLYV